VTFHSHVNAERRTGFVIPTHDAKAMAKAIARLLRDPPIAAAMGEAGLKRVRERFTVERMVAETRKVNERVVREPRHDIEPMT
jgi:glycosyltransferase involved in cell wall biosynthesis